MSPNIVFLDMSTIDLNDIDFSALEKLGNYTNYQNSNEDEVIFRVKNADIIMCNKTPISKKVIDSLRENSLVTVVATGYNNVDIDSARTRGIVVSNVPGYAVNTVPQHTFALILNLATKVYRYYNDVQNGKWHNAESFTLLTYPTVELANKTIGIIGFGAIGRSVAGIAEAFGMKVLANDSIDSKDSRYGNTDLDYLLRHSDIVTLHCPLTTQTRNLINKESIEKMKDGALLINTARGGIADECAVATALNNGKLAGAGFDVLSIEPPKQGNILLSAKNIIITPHCAWSTIEARQRLIDETVLNIKAFLSGKPRNRVS